MYFWPLSSKDQLGNLWVAVPSVLTSKGRVYSK